MPNKPETATPNTVKRILCLANSRKLSGRCVAGREIVNSQAGAWIRPVSDREHQEVSEEEQRYEDGTRPQVLDVIDLPLIELRPHQFQQENWLLDQRFYWRKADRLDWTGLEAFVDPVAPLWINNQSSYNGLNDRVALNVAAGLRSSLRLIRVDSLLIQVFRPGEAFNNPKRRVQGQFTYAGTQHWLWITDPIYERSFLAQPDGTHALGECCLTISLGEPYQDHAYKLIAAIIEKEEYRAK